MWRHREVLIRGWAYTKGHRGKLFVLGLCTVAMALLPLLAPWPLAFLIDNVLGQRAYPGPLAWLDDASPVMQIAIAVALMLGIDLLTHAIGMLAQWLEVKFELRTVMDFRSALLRHTQKLSLTFLDQQSAGQFIYQINYHAHSMGALITTTLPLIQMLITVIGALVITWLIAPTLALIAAATIPFIVMSTTIYNKYVEPTLLRVRTLEGGSMGIVHESIAMMRVVVTFCRESFEHRVFRENAERGVSARVHLTMRQTVFIAIVSLITAIGTAAAVGYSAYLIVNGNSTVGFLYVVLDYMRRVYQPLEQLSTTIAGIQEQFINLKLCFGLLDQEIDITERDDATVLPAIRGEVRFEHVSFSYPNGRSALSDIDVAIGAGEKVAIVGPTGAGKSTLMSLLTRLSDPSEGRVLIDGHDLRDLTIESIRSQVALVTQDPLLFGRTIRENIRYGRPTATDEEVVAAATAANAHEFIAALPGDYDMRLGERGTGISGGERQRITVARAFLKDAPILILDEPTSSIDSRTEAIILDALERLSQGRTTFVIAHRLSTIADADRILVIDGGRLVESGRHEQLLAAGGLYAEMWMAQTGVRQRSPQLPPPFVGEAPEQSALAHSPEADAARVEAEIELIVEEAEQDASRRLGTPVPERDLAGGQQ